MKIIFKIIAILLLIFGSFVIFGGILVIIDGANDLVLNIIMVIIFGVTPIFGGVLILRQQRNKTKIEISKSQYIENVRNIINEEQTTTQSESLQQSQLSQQVQREQYTQSFQIDLREKSPIDANEHKQVEKADELQLYKGDTLSILRTTLGTGEILKIKYHGGSQPGSIREVVPEKLEGKMLYAYCHSSKRTKSFLINKIEIVPNEEKNSYAYGNTTALKTLKELFDTYNTIWEQLGWHIAFEEKSIGLHKKGKRGNPLKYPDIRIYYDDEVYDYTDFSDDSEEIRYSKITEKPWCVRDKHENTIRFKRLDNAIKRFLDYYNNTK